MASESIFKKKLSGREILGVVVLFLGLLALTVSAIAGLVVLIFGLFILRANLLIKKLLYVASDEGRSFEKRTEAVGPNVKKRERSEKNVGRVSIKKKIVAPFTAVSRKVRELYTRFKKRTLGKALLIGAALAGLGVIFWLGFNALLLLSDASCDIACNTDVSSGGYFWSSLTPDIDCSTSCDTFCTSGFSFGGYQSAPNCNTYCDTSCESSSIDASDIDVDVNCGASCGLYPPRLNARTIETLFSPRYLRILLYRSFGLQL